MTEDIDVWRAAKLMLDRHGDTAEIAAAQCADELLEEGDMDGRAVWLHIVAAVRELQRGRKPGESLN